MYGGTSNWGVNSDSSGEPKSHGGLREEIKLNATSALVSPGVNPHQQGNLQSAFVSSSSKITFWDSSGEYVGNGVRDGVGEGLAVRVGTSVNVGGIAVAVGSR